MNGFDSKRAMAEVAKGTSFVCAMCTKYWAGKEIRTTTKKLIHRIRDDQLCTADRDCGSPLGGDVFTAYDGPLTDFARFCFVCGNASEFGVRVRNLVRVVGVCETHAKWFPHFEPKPKGSQEVTAWKQRELVP